MANWCPVGLVQGRTSLLVLEPLNQTEASLIPCSLAFWLSPCRGDWLVTGDIVKRGGGSWQPHGHSGAKARGGGVLVT